MSVGVSSYAYRWAVQSGGMDVSALLERARDAGAEVVQICDNLPLDGLPDGALADLAGRGNALGLTLELGVKGSRPEHLRRAVTVARRIGARLLRTIVAAPGWAPSFDEAVGAVRAVLPDLRAAGVTLAIENHFYLPPAELARLVETVGDPLVGVCLDPLNSITQLVGVGETVRTLAPLAVSLHVKDAVVSRRGTGFLVSGCPLGEGLVDVPGLLAAVRGAGRSPNVLLEGWMDRLEDEAATLAQEEDWVRRGIAYLHAHAPAC